MSNLVSKNPTTVIIEDAYDSALANPDSSKHEKLVLRVGRIAARRRDSGLSWNLPPYLKALAAAR